MSEPKFKVGDRVRHLPEFAYHCPNETPAGDSVFTISAVDNEDELSATTYDFEEGGTSFEFRLELATELKATPSTIRKNRPLARGCLDYFPAALAAVSELSRIGNEKHNPGEDMHHARGKSSDHADCILRHLVDRGTEDPETGLSHSVAVAWRALALLQEELEAAGAPVARGAK